MPEENSNCSKCSTRMSLLASILSIIISLTLFSITDLFGDCSVIWLWYFVFPIGILLIAHAVCLFIRVEKIHIVHIFITICVLILAILSFFFRTTKETFYSETSLTLDDLSNDFKGFKQESTIYLIVSGEPVSDTNTKATIKKDEIKKVIKKMYEDLVKTGKEKNNVIMHQAFEDPSVIKNKGDATLILDLINSLKFTRIKKGGIISICANGVPQMIKDKKQGQDYDKLKNIIEEKIKKKK
ncbi:hypothetical protein CWI36_0874p0010 [Hamiltosporidium magnivora]|uniref:Uncharacterized protein n=1 Tax=Hamiltosporidium magnivora TaxID=148818 RepID=A0A4Q9L0C7_9MICR|nr:hypothetical protein CWI36_1714p0010 [Hamiltosporidium magnivora]TBU03723.1 hypothetical protein CWI36_0874p0010 [Hamiltosporidium magnivora]